MSRFICVALTFLLLLTASAQEQKRVIIDADTANEVDDLYAIVQALIEPTWDVIGLNATQWQVSHWSVGRSMEESYRLNGVLLSYLQMTDVASNRGAEARLFDWGNKSQPSTASNFIIREAHATDDGKLDVIALGALTNVASALLDDPSIADRIRLYWLGSAYDFDRGAMTNIDFNSVMDIQAVHVVLNADVETHIMPVNVAAEMTMDWHETVERLQGQHEVLDLLIDRWRNHMDGGRRARTIWDLALIQAVAHPEMATKTSIRTSVEKGDREVYMYRDIDGDEMRADFFGEVVEHVRTLP